ncbi:MAG: putative ABC transport system permease protein [Flammeovirgaceae bacterium]|jgi:putative ABC transport system permease protein
MNFLKLSWQNIITRPLGAILSIVLLGLSVMLISLMLHIGKQFEQMLYRNIEGIDMVLGAKGSPLQLVLSSVFHIDSPTGNISKKEASKIAKNPLVKNAIPLSYGDSYKGFRIVGTEKEYLNLYRGELQEGDLFQNPFEIVVGATVANQLKLELGQIFYSQHGFGAEGESHASHPFKVVGILKSNGTVLDKLLLTPQESVWESHKHEEGIEKEISHIHSEEHSEHHHNVEEEEEHHEITAMLIKFRSPMGVMQLPRYVNEKTTMQSAIPSYEIHRLIGLMDEGIKLLRWLASSIMIVSCFSIFIGLYNAISERKYEMALLRNFGASRWQLVTLVLQEGLILTLLGFGVGIMLSRSLLLIFSSLGFSNFQFDFGFECLLIEEFYLFLIVLLLGVSSSVLPAIQIFRLQISKLLSER